MLDCTIYIYIYIYMYVLMCIEHNRGVSPENYAVVVTPYRRFGKAFCILDP